MNPRNFELAWQCLVEGGPQGYEVITGTCTLNPGEPLHVKADLPEGTLIKVIAETNYRMEEDTLALFNGFQSWSYTPEYRSGDSQRGVSHLPKALVNRFSLDRYGDSYFTRYEKGPGRFHGWSWCHFRESSSFLLLASLDEKPGYTKFSYDHAAERITIMRDCCGIRCGGEYPIFDLFCDFGTEKEVYGRWFDALGILPRTSLPVAGYCSWYNRYQNISDISILEDLSGCRDVLHPGDLFQIDDGWEPFVGDWLETDKNKFPGGMKEMADAIHASGFRAGLWIAPFIAEEKSALYQKHPEMFLRMHGTPWKAGCNWSGFYSLNIDHPGTKQYLKEVFHKAIHEWGFDYFKLDFLYAAAPFGTSKETRAARMMRAVGMLRELCEDKLIDGCGVPLFPAFGVVDYCRIGCDVSLDWDDKPYMRITHPERVSTLQSLTNTVSRFPLDGRAFGNDPDVFFLREKNLRLSKDEKEVLSNAAAAYGSVLMVSDATQDYTAKMKDQYASLRAKYDARWGDAF